MLYKISELAEDLKIPDRTLRDWLAKFGAPYQRDPNGHIWVNGVEFAAWVNAMSQQKKKNTLQPGQAYCLRCKKPVALVNPELVEATDGPKLLRAVCPQCGGKVFRGASHDLAQ